MLNQEAVSKVTDALFILTCEWGGLKRESERAKEIVSQYNRLMDALLDWGFDPYVDYLDVAAMLPDKYMSKRYLIAIKDPIPPDHEGF